MKCRYKFCKNNNEVSKKDAIKESTAYYCKECYQEKQNKKAIEEYYSVNMTSCTIQNLRKAIKQIVNDKGFDSEYLLFTVKYIKEHNKPINYPFGLLNYVNNLDIKRAWKTYQEKEDYKEIKDDILNSEDKEKEVKFQYKNNNKELFKLI
ncbi:MAG: hypothetical protein ACRDDY_15635 [Clostridium sp.]|uniref:hypothetical protein n=1 Tax=Clostridium sp. TaxID=1506 RepID=UPI003EE772F2